MYDRHLRFVSVSNFRDIGGYKTRRGRAVAWRRVFRSGEFARISQEDYQRLMEEIMPASVLDLRSKEEVERQGIGLLAGADLKYHNVCFIADGGDREANERRYRTFTNMGQFYLDLVGYREYGQRIVEALEIIADTRNHPLVFNCAVGKDRTGMLAACLLDLLDVDDKDIIEDYCLSEPYMDIILETVKNDPKLAEGVKSLPEYFWKASPRSMKLFLDTLRKEYGSVEGYLQSVGGDSTLAERLRKALLV